MKLTHLHTVLLALIPVSGAALAQIPGLPGGASKALGMPDLSSMIPGNAAGVLDYCLKNEILGGTEANSVLDGVMGKPEVTGTDDFAAGAAGTLITGKQPDESDAAGAMASTVTGKGPSSLSIDSLPEPVKSKVCDAALSQAKSLL